MLQGSLLLLARVYGSVTSSFTPGSIGGSSVNSRNGLNKVYPTSHESVLNNNNYNYNHNNNNNNNKSPYSESSQKNLLFKKERIGSLFAIADAVRHNEKELRKQLNEFLAEERDPFKEVRSSLDSELRGAHMCGAYPQKKLVNLPGVERVRDLPADPITRLFFQHKAEHALYYGTFDNPSEQDLDRAQIASRVRHHRWHHNIPPPMYDFCHRIREACEQRKRFVIVPSTLETRGCAQVMLNHGLVAGFRDFHNDRAFAVELKYFQNESTINVIAPCSYDCRTEFEWSPKMMRRLMNSHGIHNRIVIYMCRTADNRVIDHIQAVKECIGGRGLMMVH